MSILRDILDFKKDVTSIDTNDISMKRNTRNSIARESSPGVLQFPVLVSTALSLEETTMISKALEREYVSFISVITSIDSITDEKSVKDYIKRIHQNYNGEVVSESMVFSRPKIDTNLMKQFRESEETTVSIMKQLREEDGNPCYNDDLDTVVHYDQLEEEEKDQVLVKVKKKCVAEGIESCFIYGLNSGINSIIVNENTTSPAYKQILIVKNIENDNIRLIESVSFPVAGKGINVAQAEKSLMAESSKLLKDYVPDFNLDILNEKTSINNNYAMIGTGIIKDRYRGNKISEANSVGDLSKKFVTATNNDVTSNPIPEKDTVVLKDILRDNDAKKANELVPTMMHLKTYFKNDDGTLNSVDYLIGVKTIVHPINSSSVIENVVKCMKRGKGFFNLMRLTTGEISFFKDFVFAVPRIKDDIKTKFFDNPWISTLMRRRKYSKILKVLNFKQQLVPNAAIVITMDEVEMLRTEHEIDMMDLKKANDLMDQLFLLSFVIVDSSVKTCYFLFDGQKSFQQYSFTALERENSNSAKEVQNIMQVLGRM